MAFNPIMPTLVLIALGCFNEVDDFSMFLSQILHGTGTFKSVLMTHANFFFSASFVILCFHLLQLNIRRWWIKMEFDRKEDMPIALLAIICLIVSVINDCRRGLPGEKLANNLLFLVLQIVSLYTAGKFSI